ncbi:DUF2059 domain-containing protein [Niveispirillum sp.]|uniref:DUF2059 domain-containing protein n=1 Tax=Niveispirillum sp. TaxID=1917217 RepID=UPI001B5097CC|nr:DUF2059 domain-containing protein [Niveispirillum sp.]MBP7335024.1 DUF2059 domain-containing protein [Niveispirillum sp.]
MRPVSAILILFLALLVAAPAQAAPGKGDDVQRLEKARILMELSGSQALADQTLLAVTRQAEELMAHENPGREAEVTALVRDHFLPKARAALPDLSRGITGLYAAHFTAAELDQMIGFYRSPAGRKLVALSPIIIEQSMSLGQAWAEGVADRAWDSFTRAARDRGLAIPKQL